MVLKFINQLSLLLVKKIVFFAPSIKNWIILELVSKKFILNHDNMTYKHTEWWSQAIINLYKMVMHNILRYTQKSKKLHKEKETTS